MFYKANEKYNSNLSAGYTAGQTTLSVAETPDNVPTIVTVGFGTDKEATFIAEGKSLGTLTGVTRLRGYNGNIDANTAITCLNNEEFINQVENVVSTPETLIPLIYAIDGGSTDAYAISLDVPPSAYVAGMYIAFKANTANTGACTLNVNSVGAVAIKKNGNEDLNDNDIKSGQIVQVVYDGTNWQLMTSSTAKASGAEVTAGSEENKFVTPKSLADSDYANETFVNNAVSAKVINRAFAWYLDGTSIVADEVGAKYIAPQGMTVNKIWYKTTSGTATIRIQKGTTDINASMSVTSTLGSDDTITTPSISAGDVITLDITSASSPVGLTVVMECSQ